MLLSILNNILACMYLNRLYLDLERNTNVVLTIIIITISILG